MLKIIISIPVIMLLLPEYSQFHVEFMGKPIAGVVLLWSEIVEEVF